MDQCYNALTDQLDWTNLKGGRCPYDLSKPLPLQGSPGHLTIPVDFFFNTDLEYLKTGNSERKYTTSITKTKVAKYELEFIEEMIPKLLSLINKFSKHDVYSTMKILSAVSIKVDKQFGYGYLKQIVTRRADWKMYTFKEDGDEIVDLAVALLIREKLNITNHKKISEISAKEPYTTSFDLKGVVNLNSRKRKRLMRADELYNNHTAKDDLEVFSTGDLGLDWIFAHNFLTCLQKLSSYASGHLEISKLDACLEKASFSSTSGHVEVF
ncbi:hypothetical protein Tco_0336150 [Tanacetum coccineum]